MPTKCRLPQLPHCAVSIACAASLRGDAPGFPGTKSVAASVATLGTTSPCCSPSPHPLRRLHRRGLGPRAALKGWTPTRTATRHFDHSPKCFRRAAAEGQGPSVYHVQCAKSLRTGQVKSGDMRRNTEGNTKKVHRLALKSSCSATERKGPLRPISLNFTHFYPFLLPLLLISPFPRRDHISRNSEHGTQRPLAISKAF